MHPSIVLSDAWRAIVRHPISSLLTLLILAAGFSGCIFSIGMNRAISGKDTPLPADLVFVGERVNGRFQGMLGSLMSQLPEDLDVVAARQSGFLVQPSPGQPLSNMTGLWVDAPLFGLLNWPMALGRDFIETDFSGAAETESGAPSVVIISHDYWRNVLASKADVIGSFITIDGNPQRIVGVLPQYRAFPHQEKVYLPMRIRDNGTFKDRYFYLLARANLQQREELSQQLGVLETRAREQKHMAPTGKLVVQAYDQNFGSVEYQLISAVTIFLGWLLLMLTAVNASGILLSQWFAKLHENATRSALGCSRATLLATALIHAGILTLGALVVSLLTLHLLMPTFEQFLHAQNLGLPAFVRMNFKTGMLTPILIAVLLCSALVALPVFLQVKKLNLMRNLRTSLAQPAASPKLNYLLIGAQCVMSMTAVMIAFMCARGAVVAKTQDYGLSGEGVVIARLRSADLTVQETEARRLLEQLKNSPEVQMASASVALPQIFVTGREMVLADGAPVSQPTNDTSQNSDAVAEAFPVDEAFFGTYQIKIRRGRALQSQDMQNIGNANLPKPVVVVDRAAAVRMYGTDDVVGKSFPYIDAQREIRRPVIVGVTEDVNLGMGQGQDGPSFFLPLWWNSNGGISFSIKTDQPERVLQLLNKLAPTLDSRVGLYNTETYLSGLHRASAGYRILGSLFAPIGILALVLTATGLGATLASIVTQRNRQTAIRRALGASGGISVAPIIRPLAITSVIGLTLGIALALPVAFSLSRVIYDASGLPVWLIAASLAFVILGLTIACVPAISRALRVDPNVVLKQD
jgi:ABC-type antimicrobial peptide transport system permease subunit